MCLLAIRYNTTQTPPHTHTPCEAMTAMALKLDRFPLWLSFRGNNVFQRFHESDFKDVWQNIPRFKSLCFLRKLYFICILSISVHYWKVQQRVCSERSSYSVIIWCWHFSAQMLPLCSPEHIQNRPNLINQQVLCIGKRTSTQDLADKVF